MGIDELRNRISMEQKKGLPFILASIVIWGLIAAVSCLDIPIMTKNLLVFCCSCPMLPLAWMIGKLIHVDLFSKENPLGQLGFLFTLNQLICLLIVMWVFNAVPEKMVMVYAMVFGAHLFPCSWLYQSNGYKAAAIVIPAVSLLGTTFSSGTLVAVTACIIEVIFAITLSSELKKMAVSQ